MLLVSYSCLTCPSMYVRWRQLPRHHVDARGVRGIFMSEWESRCSRARDKIYQLLPWICIASLRVGQMVDFSGRLPGSRTRGRTSKEILRACVCAPYTPRTARNSCHGWWSPNRWRRENGRGRCINIQLGLNLSFIWNTLIFIFIYKVTAFLDEDTYMA